MPKPPMPLYELLLGLFRSIDDLYVYLATYDYPLVGDLVNALPGPNIPRTTYTLKVIELLQAHGIDDHRFFDTLAAKFPGRRDRVEAARRDYFAAGAADPGPSQA